VKVSFCSEYYLSILIITVDLKLDFDIAYGVGETRTQNQWTIGGFSRKSLFSK
jgi:hypothetical protein